MYTSASNSDGITINGSNCRPHLVPGQEFSEHGVLYWNCTLSDGQSIPEHELDMVGCNLYVIRFRD